MIIRNAKIYTPAHRFEAGSLVLRGGRIADAPAEPLPGEEILDAGGAYAIPGLVDVHLHGAAGADFSDADPAGLQTLLEYEASRGVLACCPAAMTLPEETLCRVCETAAAHENGSGADLAGIHLEGPFLSPGKAGAQNRACLTPPDAALFRRLQQKSGGRIKIVDIAPELPGAAAFLKACAGEVRIGIAHTCADYDTARQAFADGACRVTHLYNAMPGIHHRAPGPVIAAWEAGVYAELICDGVHLHDAVARFTFQAFGDDRVILVSDSMRAAGLPDGQYTLGGQAVTVQGARAVLTECPDTIAGSVTDLFGCLRHCITAGGIAPESAVRACTENPAKSIGIDGDYGSLQPGRYGNVLLCGADWSLLRVIQKGIVLR